MFKQMYVKRLYNLSKWLTTFHATKPKRFRNVSCSLGFPQFFLIQDQRQGSVWLRNSMHNLQSQNVSIHQILDSYGT